MGACVCVCTDCTGLYLYMSLGLSALYVSECITMIKLMVTESTLNESVNEASKGLLKLGFVLGCIEAK